MALTRQRLAEIADRIPHGYPGPWTVTPAKNGDGGLDWLIGYPTDNPDAGLVATVPDYGEGLAEFIAHARQDVVDLLAEVHRLHPCDEAATDPPPAAFMQALASARLAEPIASAQLAQEGP